MLTTAQIFAIIQLLLAFNVPQANVNTVQGILEATQNPVVATTTQSVQIALPPVNNAPQAPVFGATIQTEPIQPTQPIQTVIAPAMSPTLEIVHNSPIAGKESFVVTFNAKQGNGTIDKTAQITVTSTAPWWWPHGATVCNKLEDRKFAPVSGDCNILIGVPTNITIPSDPGNYTMTATWGDISTTTDIVVQKDPSIQ